MQARSRDTVHRLRIRDRPVDPFEYVQSVVDRLRIVKGTMTYSQMESSCGVHPTLLCRYVTGTTRPSKEQAELLEKTLLRRSAFKDKIKQRMKVAPGGYLDLHEVIGDPNALRWIASEVSSQFSKLLCDRILTAASSGITLATAVAMQMKVPIVYATHTKSSGAGSYIETDLHSTNPSEISTLYLPSDFAKKGDSILIVDDVATSGRTLSGLVELVKKANCKLSGIFVLVSRSKAWRDRISQELSDNNVKVSVFFDMTGEA